MRKYLLILLLYPSLVHSQTDSITVKVPIGDPTGIAPMGTRFMTLSQPSAIRYLKIESNNDLSLRTAAQILSDIGAQAAGSYQPLATNLTSIGGLANGNGFLKNNGSGTFSYETPAGSGDLLAANNLSDLANSATARTNIGLSTTANLTNSTNKNFVTDAQTTVIGNTSGTNTGDDATNTQYSGLAASKQDALISGTNIKTINGTTILGAGNVTITSTAGVGTSPTASSTVTITHNLGRVPTIIRIYGYGTFTANAAATATTSSMGVFNSSGNFCVYQRYGAAITTTQAGLTSNTFCILLATGGGSFISGVIQNVTSTQFDIAWTETGTATAQPYLWEAQ